MLGKVTNFPNGISATGNNAAALGIQTDAMAVSGALTAGTIAGAFKNTIGAATATAGAATLNALQGKITSESLTTAQNADYTLTITNSAVVAGDIVFVSIANGTNSAGSPVLRTAVTGSNQIVVVIRNMHTSAVAFNGTLVVSFQVFRA